MSKIYYKYKCLTIVVKRCHNNSVTHETPVSRSRCFLNPRHLNPFSTVFLLSGSVTINAIFSFLLPAVNQYSTVQREQSWKVRVKVRRRGHQTLTPGGYCWEILVGVCHPVLRRVLEAVICVTVHASWYPGPRGFSWFFLQKERASREAATLHTFGTLCWSEVQNFWFLFHCYAIINLKIYLMYPSLPLPPPSLVLVAFVPIKNCLVSSFSLLYHCPHPTIPPPQREKEF